MNNNDKEAIAPDTRHKVIALHVDLEEYMSVYACYRGMDTYYKKEDNNIYKLRKRNASVAYGPKCQEKKNQTKYLSYYNLFNHS